MSYTPPIASAVNFSWVGADAYSPNTNFIWQPAGVLVPNRAVVDQVYELQKDYFINWLDQPYHLPWPIFTEIEQIYGIKLAALLSQKWGDSPGLRQQLVSWYGANPTHRRILWQPYGVPLALRVKMAQQYRDALRHLAATEQYYPIHWPLLSSQAQPYHLTDAQLQATLEQLFALQDNNPVRRRSEQIYAVAGDSSTSSHTFSVTIGGDQVTSMTDITIEAGRGQYSLAGDMQLTSLSEFVACSLLDPVVITHAGESFHFILSSKSRNRSIDDAAYNLELSSPSVLLDAPYALPVTNEYPEGMAADLAQQIVAGCTDQVTLVWQLVNWPMPKNTLYATDETPLSILRRLVGSVGGILQSLPDGSLVAMPSYPVDIDKLAGGPVTAYYTDTENIFTVQDDPDPRDGYNSYLISDGLLSEAGHILAETSLTSTTKHVDGYVIPWTETGVSLETSGGDWVSVEPLGVHTETIEEQIEIVRGEGRTSKPIHAMLDRSYRARSLGAISYSEDGSLLTAIDGESLVLVTYQTKYHRWLLTDNQIEDVQCILQTEE